jgi:aryl-alcohol dehydrogenase-like predicted oxidoreductase
MYRFLGNTKIKVSEIGFGCWGIGGVTPGATSYGQTDDRVSLSALELAYASGVNFFDTSNVYGNGNSESLLGSAFSKIRDKVVIATKVGFADYQSIPDFSLKGITLSVNQSLNRLKTDYIDLLQLHNPNLHTLSKIETFNALDKLKKNGKVNSIGISIKKPEDASSLLKLYPFDVIQVNFNMLDIRALSCGLIDEIDKLGVGLIARTPLAFGFLSGSLTGEENFSKEDHRSLWPREQIRLWAEGSKETIKSCKESLNSPAYEIALRFCLSYAQVSTVIVGMLNSKEVNMNVNASDKGPLSINSCNRILEIHKKKQFFNP